MPDREAGLTRTAPPRLKHPRPPKRSRSIRPPRTLQRRLAAERTTFHALVDGVRADVARHHLGDRRRSLSEIAYLCGYSELSAFLRAFKRWTGQTPSELRVAS